ncbi:MAG: group 1 truncated hemoglobin [Myxococcales bacterium]|nr:group 1 truncated hemoglobin [Myxococcales bacterium]
MDSFVSIRGGIAAVALCALAACSPTNNNADTGVVTDSGGGGGDGGGTLYTRLGGRAGIATAVDAIVAQELMDPEIASYFYFQVTPGSSGMPPVNGHPSVAQLKSCLVNQLANAAGGPEAYPGTPADNMGWQCRNMADSHRELRIPGTVFDRFVMIAAGVLTSAGVAPADITVIGGVLNSTRSAIVDPSRDGGAFIPPTDASAGGG